MWLSQGFGGTGGKGHLFQGNKGTKAKILGEERQYWGAGNIRKHLEGNKLIYFRGTREQSFFFRGTGEQSQS